MDRIKIRTSKITLYDTIYSKLTPDMINKPIELIGAILSDNDKKLTIESILYNHLLDQELLDQYMKLLKQVYVDLINSSDNITKVLFRFEYYLLTKQNSFNYVRNKALLYLILTHPCIHLKSITELQLDNYKDGVLTYRVGSHHYPKELDDNVKVALDQHIKINNIVNYLFDISDANIVHMLDKILGCSINKIRSLYYYSQ